MFAGPDFDPREVTAADVAYGLTRALDPTPDGAAAQSWGAGYLFPIKGAEAFAKGEAETVEGIEVVDDHTLKITLTEPTTTFLLGLTIATSWPVPKEAVEARGEDFKSSPVGAGPFFISEWNKGSDITLARNPGYVDPTLPYLDEIHIDLGVDENTQVVRLEGGDADSVFEQFALSPASLRLLAQNPDLTSAPSVGPRIFYLALNNDGIFKDKRLRQAVAHAQTTDFTAQFGELAKPWNQLMSSTTAQSDPEGTTTYAHDPAAATALLEEAGYDGTPVKLVYDVTDPYTSANATALRQDLEAVGFTVDLRGLQKTQFYSDIYDPAQYDISSTYWSADYPDAQDYISTNFLCGQIAILNISRFCDPAIDKAFEATERMPFGPERDAALRAVQQRLIDEVAGIPVMEVTPQVVSGGRVGEIPTLATYAPFDWKRAWVRADG
jgi:ABC-type transport system substrate-binding protein